MKYLKMFEGGLPPISKKAMKSIKKEKREIDRLKQSGTHDEVLYYYENLKEKTVKASGRPDIFTSGLPIQNSIYELKILLRDKFDMDIDDGVDVDKYLEEKSEKPFMKKVKDKLKRFGDFMTSSTPTEDMGPGNGTTHSDDNRKDFEGGAW